MRLSAAKVLRPWLLASALAALAAPALATSYTYQGELSFSARAGDVCAPAITESTFKYTFPPDSSALFHFSK